MPAPSLLLFTLGPVQDFIAAGRRTADLWAGSLLLSRLSEIALTVVAAQATILFPATASASQAAPGQAAVPNRFLAEVPAGTDVAALARAAEDAVRTHLRKAAVFAFGKMGLDVSGVEAAVSFVEVYWTAVPMDREAVAALYTDAQSTDAYGYLYRVIEGLSGSRRGLRSFSGRSESGYRCTLMPSQPAIELHGGASPGAVRAAWEKVAEGSNGRLRKGERLSAIALTKRFYPDFLRSSGVLTGGNDAAFPSTSTFAAADFMGAVLSAGALLEPLVEAYEQAAKDLRVHARFTEAALPGLAGQGGAFRHLSGRLLLGDDVTPEEIERDTGTPMTEQDLQPLNQARRVLLSAAGKVGIQTPSRYYAVLVLDGDKMGEWLSGTRAPEAFGGATGQARQQAISTALDRFALKDVPEIVEHEHLGRLVYGGGDDVVALLSFETALDAACAVSAAFRKALPGGTVSAGLVLAHHLTPLSQVLGAARAAEKRAKNSGRDRLCIVALKRSGAPSTAVVPWDDLGPVERFRDLIRGNRDRQVSTGLLYDLEDLRRRMSDLRPDVNDSLPIDALPMMKVEAQRLFERRVERLKTAAGQPHEQAAASAFDDTLGPMLEGSTNAALSLAGDRRRNGEALDAAAHRLVALAQARRAGPSSDPCGEASLLPTHPFDALLGQMAVAQFLGKGGDR